MADQRSGQWGGGAGPTTSGSTTTVTTGAIYGLDYEEANSPLILSRGTEGTPGTPGIRHGVGMGISFRSGGHPGTPGKKPTMGTVQQGVSAFYHMSQGERDQYIVALADAGYLKIPKKGRASTQSINSAWRAAVVDAARSGQTVIELLSQPAAGGPEDPFASEGAGQVAQLTDPAALHATVDQAAQKVLGRNATDDEKRLFTSMIHGQETGYANNLNAGATSVTSTSPEAQALEFAQRADPVRADSRKVLDTFGVIAKMFGGQ